jgi:ComF family protein
MGVRYGRCVFSSSGGHAVQLALTGFASRAGKLAPLFGGLLWPDDCRLCGEPLREFTRVPVCGACLRAPVPLDAEYFCSCCRTPFMNAFPLDELGRCALCRSGAMGYDAAYSFGAYDGPLRKLIHLLKYERVTTLARPLGAFLTAAYPREQRFDALVPMPLHWRRRWSRGFNQSALLAREVGRRLGIPVVSAVRRQRATSPQAGLTNSKRRLNVTGAFAASGALVRGARLLLLDDVLTTGATASACARALKRGGAGYVAVLTLARADRRFGGASGVLS